MENYYCYMIINEKNHVYIGVTNNMGTRIKKHNGELKGGAKATRKSTQWKYHTTIGPMSKERCLRFEWYWKHKKNKNDKWISISGVKNKVLRLNKLIEENEWSDLVIVKH